MKQLFTIETINQKLKQALLKGIQEATIPNFSRYVVNLDGVVRNRKTGEIIKSRNKTRKSNRQRLDLVNDAGERKTLHSSQVVVSAFSRIAYDIISKIGDVDHKDDNCANDHLKNLQILTHDENKKKYREHRAHIKGADLRTELQKRDSMLKKVA